MGPCPAGEACARDTAADFPSVDDAFDHALAEGFSHAVYVHRYPKTQSYFYIYRQAGAEWHRHTMFHAGGKWHISKDADFAHNLNLPLEAEAIRGAQPAAKDCGATGAVAVTQTVVAADARRGAVRPLKWHRDKSGLFARAANGVAVYRIHERKERVSRREGKLPWVLTLDGAELKSYDHVAQAKRGAEKHNKAGASLPSSLAPTPETSVAPPAAPAAPLCAPFTAVRVDAEKFRACAQLADTIGPITTPQAIYKLLKGYCNEQPQEVFLVVSLDLHGHLRGIDEVARGQIDRVNVGIDDIMRASLAAALARQAKGFAVVHCHPSGKATPSQADKDLTRAIEKARKPFGNNLKLVDHVVIGLDQFASIRLRKVFRAKRA